MLGRFEAPHFSVKKTLLQSTLYNIMQCIPFFILNILQSYETKLEA